MEQNSVLSYTQWPFTNLVISLHPILNEHPGVSEALLCPQVRIARAESSLSFWFLSFFSHAVLVLRIVCQMSSFSLLLCARMCFHFMPPCQLLWSVRTPVACWQMKLVVVQLGPIRNKKRVFSAKTGCPSLASVYNFPCLSLPVLEELSYHPHLLWGLSPASWYSDKHDFISLKVTGNATG